MAQWIRIRLPMQGIGFDPWSRKIPHAKQLSPNAAAVEPVLPWCGGSDSKESACNAGDAGLIPGSGSSPGGGHGKPLQYSCLENHVNRGTWQATFHGVTQSQTHTEAT